MIRSIKSITFWLTITLLFLISVVNFMPISPVRYFAPKWMCSTDCLIQKNYILLENELEALVPLEPTINENWRKILSRQPFSTDVLRQSAELDIKLERPESVNQKLLTAQKISKRNRKVNKLLFFRHALVGDIDGAIQQLDLSYRLTKTGRQEYLAVFSNLLNIPELAELIISHLNKDPIWAAGFVRYQILNSTEENINSLLSMSQVVVKENRQAPEGNLLDQYLTTLISHGLFAPAYQIWKKQNQVNIDSQQFVFNPTFKDLPYPPPFNWKLFPKVSELEASVSSKGLSARFFGQSALLVARQYFALRGESAVLNISGSYSRSNDQSYFTIKLNCIDDKSELFKTNFTSSDDKRRNQSKITISESINYTNCSAAEIQILAIPGEGFSNVTLDLVNIKFVRKN